jgi:hypothetical protein
MNNNKDFFLASKNPKNNVTKVKVLKKLSDNKNGKKTWETKNK